MSDVQILAAGDAAMVLRLGDRIDPSINSRALAAARELSERQFPFIRDIVVGYASVTVYFDPLAVTARDIERRLAEVARKGQSEVTGGARVTVPVRYGGEHGPDLAEVAAFAGCSEDEVAERHMAREYRVFMIGFLPGFPYMGTVDERIAMPRRETPRLEVPAGSVGIAGLQTGVYPVVSPGGWRLIGRTELPLFDPDATPPAILSAGDVVRFTRAS